MSVNEKGYEALIARIDALEERIRALEARVRALEGDTLCDKTFAGLLEENALVVDKKRAAALLGVTRATIYTMVKDGRLRECAGSGIETRSIAEFISRHNGQNNPYRRTKRGGNTREKSRE